MSEKRMLYLKEKSEKMLDSAMTELREELKFSEEETHYNLSLDTSSRNLVLELHNRIFKKVKKIHAELNYDCGLTFNDEEGKIIISLEHDREGIRILDLILDTELSFLRREKRERIVRNKEKIEEAIKKLLPPEVKFYTFYKKGEYSAVIKAKMLRAVFHNKSIERLIEFAKETITCVVKKSKK